MALSHQKRWAEVVLQKQGVELRARRSYYNKKGVGLWSGNIPVKRGGRVALIDISLVECRFKSPTRQVSTGNICGFHSLY